MIVAAHSEAPPRNGNGILHNETATFVATAATETLEFRTVGLATGTGTDGIANYTGVSVRAGADGYSDLGQLFPLQLTDGSYTLTVSETDAADNTTSVPVSFTLDTTAPTIISDDPSHPSGTFSTGQDLYFTLVASEALIVTGTPALTLNDGGTATYFGGSGSAYVYFHTAVAAGQNAAVLAVTGVALNGGTIQDLAGNDAVLTGANATFAGLQVDTSPLLLAVGLSTDTGVSSTDHVTSDATLFVAGKDGATVTISDGSTVLDTATVNDLANRNFVVNPTFGPANGDAGYGDVDGWSSTDTSRTGSNDDTQQFWDNGTLPDGTATVGFVEYQQGDPVESLSQTLTGLSPGSTYVLSYFENTSALMMRYRSWRHSSTAPWSLRRITADLLAARAPFASRRRPSLPPRPRKRWSFAPSASAPAPARMARTARNCTPTFPSPPRPYRFRSNCRMAVTP